VDYQRITDDIENLCQSLGLTREIKHTRITDQYLVKYMAVVDRFMDYVVAGKVRVRIMFRQNSWEPVGLTAHHRSREYWLLYYQFIKHGLGFQGAPKLATPYRLHIWFDRLPDNAEERTGFFQYLLRLPRQDTFRNRDIRIGPRDLHEAESASPEFRLLQCLDIILGSMQFRLNDGHKVKPDGKRTRGKRTIAKHKVYSLIQARARQIHPGFNIGISTGGDLQDRWLIPYRHWLFIPKGARRDKSKTKRGAPPT
jgi:hypothetical protein